MRPRATLLNEEERGRIDAEALRILSEVGVRFPSEMALDAFASGGAEVNRDTQVALLPPELVRRAVSLCPKEVFFGARDTAWDFTLKGNPDDGTHSRYNLDGCGIFTLDYGSASRRPAVLADAAAAARVFDELDAGWLAWPPISPEDVPIAPRGTISTATVMMNTSKHVMNEVMAREEVPYMAEISSILAGGRTRIAERNMYSATYCTVSPLTHDSSMMEATMDLSRIGAPVLVYPTPATGTTGPASLSYNVTLAVAEALSAIALFQLYSPGCPLVMGTAMGAVNGRTGAFSYGMPETALQLMAVGEMCAYYGMPSFNAGMTADAKMPGIQASIEKMLTAMPLTLSGTGMINGIGLLECGMTLSLEQMVIDDEMASLMRRFSEGIDVSPEKNLFEDVKAVGPGGHFLKQKNTRKLFKSDEFYNSPMLDRGTYEEWLEGGAGAEELTAKAHRRVEEILSAEQRLPMDKSTEKQIQEILKEATAKLSE
jgi:trimethylamine--corrinoid protein Co-methyltransferase